MTRLKWWRRVVGWVSNLVCRGRGQSIIGAVKSFDRPALIVLLIALGLLSLAGAFLGLRIATPSDGAYSLEEASGGRGALQSSRSKNGRRDCGKATWWSRWTDAVWRHGRRRSFSGVSGGGGRQT